MRSPILLALLFSCNLLIAEDFPFLGNTADHSVRIKADSIYRHLSTSEREHHFVWLAPNKGKNAVHGLNLVGGLYLKNLEAVDLKELPEHTTIALQLDESFNPLKKEGLPDLRTLSSIKNERLLQKYLEYLRTTSKIGGIDHLVLPGTDDFPHFEDLFFKINSYDPHFYLRFDDLSFNPSTKRKDFYPILNHKRKIVISTELLDEYQKTLKKGPRKYSPSKDELINHLTYILATPQKPVNPLPVLHEIWVKSISLFEKDSQLPVKRDTIAVWVSNENTALFESIKRYFPVVLNLKYDRIPAGVPVLIDARYNLFQATEYAFMLQKYNPVIWISTLETLVNVNASSYLITPQINAQHDEILADMVYGAEAIEGLNKLPLPVFMDEYQQIQTVSQQIVSFSKPEYLGMKPSYLDSINFLVKEMIEEKAAPGCQIMIVKQGKIVFDKAYGYLTYDSLIEVGKHTLYDLASLTKVTGTLPSIMKLVEDGKIHLDSAVSCYLPEFRETNKKDITIRQLLVHQAGLQSYIPFWKRSLSIEGLESFYYASKDDEAKDQRSYGYRPHPIMLDSLLSWIRNSSIDIDPKYRYSDIGFMILHQVVENVSGITMDEFVMENFYQPLNLGRTAFNPMNKGFEIFHIAPTEYDYYFRQEQVWGVVHDRNAAIMGGVAGHAGLFANARDMAILMQMFLQNGHYGGRDLLSDQTIKSFNKYQFEGNRRGLGWDKPGTYNPNIATLASQDSYGHTGFTGTMVWADPKEDLLFVFLSNRIFPDAENWKLNRLDTRRKIHDLIYKSIYADSFFGNKS